MCRIVLLLSLMLGSCITWADCDLLVKQIAKKMHPDLALSSVSACNKLSKNQTIIAMYYFSDTPKQNIHYPLYDLDVLLLDSKAQVLSHLHEKEFIQEAAVDFFVYSPQRGEHIGRPTNSNEIYTSAIDISSAEKYNSKGADIIFSVDFSRQNSLDQFYYSETISVLYYLKNDTGHQLLAPLTKFQFAEGIKLGNDKVMWLDNSCLYTVDSHQTNGFNDLHIKVKKENVTYPLAHRHERAYEDTKKTMSHYILKYDGREYQIPEACKAKSAVTYYGE